MPKRSATSPSNRPTSKSEKPSTSISANSSPTKSTAGNLIVVLGDQLDHQNPLLRNADRQRDIICMAEVHREATHVWCHKSRLVFFFSAMRHFAEELREQGFQVWYHQLGEDPKKDLADSLGGTLRAACKEHTPARVLMLEAGDHRVQTELSKACQEISLPLDVHDDPHYLLPQSQFRTWAGDKKNLVLEHFYRWMRKRYEVLLDDKKQPVGGDWNFDSDNRKTFGKTGPTDVAETPRFTPDTITRQVIDMVSKRFAKHPGSTEAFDLPVTRTDALRALKAFIKDRLSKFGDYQDAMWEGAEELNHSRLSPMLNIHLLNPREVIAAAEEAYHSGRVPLNSVEGFIRQILGWREFIRGIYWMNMPRYESMNYFAADGKLPQFFWDGKTEMKCVADSMRLVVNKAYAHHIQRLMVLGLLAQMLGVDPLEFHQWHMAMYSDAIDWVSLPNTVGMSQFADGGIVGTKPYCATGAYIDRMSNYCKSCRFDPKVAVGDKACPFTTLYWDFLDRNLPKIENNQRLKFQLTALKNKDDKFMRDVRVKAKELMKSWKVK
jgi:deoxyribodipyrimidine photolyase-related protein